MDGLEAVAGVGEGSCDDDRHRIIDVGLFHLLLYFDRNYLFSFCHYKLVIFILTHESDGCGHGTFRRASVHTFSSVLN